MLSVLFELRDPGLELTYVTSLPVERRTIQAHSPTAERVRAPRDAEPTDGLRNIGGHMASKPLSVFTEPGRRRRRRWTPATHGLGPFIIIALAIVGLVALVLLVLGLLDVHAVTRHFNIH